MGVEVAGFIMRFQQKSLQSDTCVAATEWCSDSCISTSHICRASSCGCTHMGCFLESAFTGDAYDGLVLEMEVQCLWKKSSEDRCKPVYTIKCAGRYCGIQPG